MPEGSGVAVVTGASRGIGRVITERLAADGRTVVALGRSADQLAEVAASCGAVPVVLDVTRSDAVQAAWPALEAAHGPVDLLVNNAGYAGSGGPTWRQDSDDWWRVFEVNVRGVFACSRAALPPMLARRRGRIVNVASNAAFFRVWDDNDATIGSAYMASKAAVVRLSEALAGETAGSGVSVFAISPGTVKTAMTAGPFAELWDDPDLWSPPELAADLVAAIDAGDLDALSGRYIHAARDWRAMTGDVAGIAEEDLHTLRVREA